MAILPKNQQKYSLSGKSRRTATTFWRYQINITHRNNVVMDSSASGKIQIATEKKGNGCSRNKGAGNFLEYKTSQGGRNSQVLPRKLPLLLLVYCFAFRNIRFLGVFFFFIPPGTRRCFAWMSFPNSYNPGTNPNTTPNK